MESSNIETTDVTGASEDLTSNEPANSKSNKVVLRKRKLPMKSKNTKSLDFVGEAELLMTSLPATFCRAINCKMRVTNAWLESTDKETVCCVTTDEGFHVKTSNEDLYVGLPEIDFKLLDMEPGSMCPFPDEHEERLNDGKDLPLACPSCWSLQRNQK